jgi:beta-lactamase regulating signal transducer with metallopeptidase domain
MAEPSGWEPLMAPLLPAVGWLVNYLIHSTLLLALGLLVAGTLGARRLAAQEVVLRAALLGGVVTASLLLLPGAEALAIWSGSAVTLPARPWAVMVPKSPTASNQGSTETPAPAVPSTRTAVVAERPGAAALARAREAGIASGWRTPTTERSDAGRRLHSWSWLASLGVLWLLGALLLSGRLAVRHALLSHRLRHRAVLGDGPLYALFRRLLCEADPEHKLRLASCRRLVVPIARGIRRPEVCVPEDIGRELTVEQQETVLAHESAHLLRQDPAWLAVYRLFEAVLFLQPLNRLVCRRLIELAEYRCDDWAVRRTGRPITLARCLTHFASWRVSGALSVASTMAGAKGGLGGRVERLLARDYPRPPRPLPRWLVPLAAVVVLAVAVAAPRVAPASETPAEPREPTAPAPAAAPMPEASPAPAAAPAPPAPTVAPAAPVSEAAPRPVPSANAANAAKAANAVKAAKAAKAPKSAKSAKSATRVSPASPPSAPSPVPAGAEVLEDGWDGMADDFDDQIDRLDDRLDRVEERLERREEVGDSAAGVAEHRREAARLRAQLRQLEIWSDLATRDLEDRLEADARRSLAPAREVLSREVELAELRAPSFGVSRSSRRPPAMHRAVGATGDAEPDRR